MVARGDLGSNKLQRIDNANVDFNLLSKRFSHVRSKYIKLQFGILGMALAKPTKVPKICRINSWIQRLICWLYFIFITLVRNFSLKLLKYGWCVYLEWKSYIKMQQSAIIQYKDGGMTIFKHFSKKFKSAAKTLKKYNESHKFNQICLLSHENFC